MTADYIENAYILDIRTETWTTREWNVLYYGPIMDSSCFTSYWKGQHRVIMVGGWNNAVVPFTEIFEAKSYKWKKLTGTDPSKTSLPYGLRSSVMAELNQIPILAGGVKCHG